MEDELAHLDNAQGSEILAEFMHIAVRQRMYMDMLKDKADIICTRKLSFMF